MESHRALLRSLASNFHHSILVLGEPPGEPWEESGGHPRVQVRSHCNWHPTFRVLSGWRAALKEFQPDVFLGLDEPYCLQTFLFKTWCESNRTPFIFLSCQNIDRPLPFPFSWLERQVLANAAGAWFLNANAYERARRRGFVGAGKVIPIGIDPERYPCLDMGSAAAGQRGSEPFTVGYVGRLVPEKGVADLIEACAKVNVRLLVAGEGPDRKRLSALAAGKGVETKWLGGVVSSKIASVYSQMDLLVLPSRTTRRWKEQFGRVLVEAMASGVPVAGSDSGEIPNVLGDAGRVFPEGNVGALAALIAEVRGDKDLCRSMADAGLRRVREKLTWSRIAGLVNSLIEETLRVHSTHQAGNDDNGASGVG